MLRKSSAAALKAADSRGSTTGCLVLHSWAYNDATKVWVMTGLSHGRRLHRRLLGPAQLGEQGAGGGGRHNQGGSGGVGQEWHGRAAALPTGQAEWHSEAHHSSQTPQPQPPHLAIRSQMEGPPELGCCFHDAMQLCRGEAAPRLGALAGACLPRRPHTGFGALQPFAGTAEEGENWLPARGGCNQPTNRPTNTEQRQHPPGAGRRMGRRPAGRQG